MSRDAINEARERITAMGTLPEGEVRGMQETFARWFHVPALLDALEAAEAERDAMAEVFEDSYPMAYTEWIEVRNAWKRRAERAEALVSTLGEALVRADEALTEIVNNERLSPAWWDRYKNREETVDRKGALESFRAFTERAPAPVIREAPAPSRPEWRRDAMIPGSSVSHSIITPECRENRGDEGAFDEAVERARVQYKQVVAGWAGRDPQPTLHLALTIERPPAPTPTVSDGD